MMVTLNLISMPKKHQYIVKVYSKVDFSYRFRPFTIASFYDSKFLEYIFLNFLTPHSQEPLYSGVQQGIRFCTIPHASRNLSCSALMYRAVITEKKAFCATAIFIVKGMKDGYFHQPNASPGSHPSTKTGSAGNIDQQAQGKMPPHAPMIRVNSSAPIAPGICGRSCSYDVFSGRNLRTDTS